LRRSADPSERSIEHRLTVDGDRDEQRSAQRRTGRPSRPGRGSGGRPGRPHAVIRPLEHRSDQIAQGAIGVPHGRGAIEVLLLSVQEAAPQEESLPEAILGTSPLVHRIGS
jgi:hypothetical protein